MKPSFAHLSPTLLAAAVAIAVSLSVFLLAGAGLWGEPIPLLPTLGGGTRSVAAKPSAPVHPRPRAHTERRASTARPAFVAPSQVVAPRSSAQSVHRAHHTRTRPRVRVVRHAPPASVQDAVATPAPATPVSSPQPVSPPRGNGKALGHQRGHAARPAVARRHGNGHARGHSPEHHHGVPPGHGKKAPAAPPKAKGGGPPAGHGGGNGDNGGNGHKEDKK